MDDLSRALADLVAILEVSPVPYAVGGSFALSVWAQPRATKDIDVTLWCTPEDLGVAIAPLLAAGAQGSIEQATREARDRGLSVLRWRGIRLDVFTPSIDFYADALTRRVRLELPGVGTTWVLSAETLVVFKLLFFRKKDLLDVEQVVVVQGAKLDRDFVRRQLVQMVEEDDARVAAWDAIVKDAAASTPPA